MLDIADYIRFFINSETPFMLLFVALFFYNIKTSSGREARLQKIIEERLTETQQDTKVLLKVWKILLEKELEETKK